MFYPEKYDIYVSYTKKYLPLTELGSSGSLPDSILEAVKGDGQERLGGRNFVLVFLLPL